MWCTYTLFKKKTLLTDFLYLGPEVAMMFNERFQLLLMRELSIEKKPIDLSYILVKFKTKMKFVRIITHSFESLFQDYDYEGKNISFSLLISSRTNGGWLNLIRKRERKIHRWTGEKMVLWVFEILFWKQKGSKSPSIDFSYER